jgi:UDPglucose 6-dehydrogenase
MEPPPSTVDSDDSLLDPSTAATTPAQSLTFSPVLHPSKFHDSLDEGSTPPITPASLNAARDAPAFRVRNICCVGAGYVGKCAPLARRHAPLIARRD